MGSTFKDDSSAATRGLTLGALRKPRTAGKRFKLFFWKYRFLHLLVLPGIIYFLVFRYLPMIGLVIAVKDYNGMGGLMGMVNAPWVGFKNFVQLFESVYFWRLIRNTVIISGLRIIFGFPAPIILAILLNEVRFQPFKKTVQTITYLPHFLSWVVITGLLSMLLGSEGPVNIALGQLFGSRPIIFLADKRYFRGLLVASGIWQSLGWNSIIYFAAISSVPTEHYEVAIVEGASRWQRTRHITIPWIKYIMVIILVLSIGNIINEDFEQIFNLYTPPVYEVADVFETYIYRKGLWDQDFSYATAVGLFKSLVALLGVLGANRVAKALKQEGLW